MPPFKPPVRACAGDGVEDVIARGHGLRFGEGPWGQLWEEGGAHGVWTSAWSCAQRDETRSDGDDGREDARGGDDELVVVLGSMGRGGEERMWAEHKAKLWPVEERVIDVDTRVGRGCDDGGWWMMQAQC